MTLKGVRDAQESWAKIFDDWSLEDLLSHKTSDGAVHPAYCCPRWLPFVDLQGGHYLAVDLAPTSAGRYGQVIVFGRDVTNNRVVAQSLAEFFDLCLTYEAQPSHPLFNVFELLKH